MAKSKLKSAAAAMMKIEAAPDLKSVWIEYPKDGEVVSHPTYTFQVTAIPEAASVELSIDGGQWLACRESMGLWWHDWEGYGPGEHRAVARIRKDGADIKSSDLRRFTVSLPPGQSDTGGK